MMPEKLAILMEICSDIYGKGVRDDYRLTTVIPKELWEGFVHDIIAEFDLPDNFTIDPSWKIYELYKSIIDFQYDNSIGQLAGQAELPEQTVVIHFDDDVNEELLEDLEVIFEKHDMPFAMVGYKFKNDKLDQSFTRSSNEDIFAYHNKVIHMFKK